MREKSAVITLLFRKNSFFSLKATFTVLFPSRYFAKRFDIDTEYRVMLYINYKDI